MSFEAENLHKEERSENDLPEETTAVYDDWLLEKRVKVRGGLGDEEELGDSCCFGIRTVETGMDCIWKLHGGV